jgi:protein-disulfide isomerase
MMLKRLWLLALWAPLTLAGTLALSSHAHAQAQSDAVLKPPPGAKLALVVFEDLECPDCARANPLLEEAARVYKIPLVRYDFPLPMHVWSLDAAILARYFDTKDTKTLKLGDAYRDFIFTNQQSIQTKDDLRKRSEEFAKQHKVPLPFAPDPQGKLAALINADKALGERVGISHTPTIYVVSNKRSGTPFVEVVDRSQLFQMIDALKDEAP